MEREGVFIGDSTIANMDNEGANVIGDGPDNKEDSHLMADCLLLIKLSVVGGQKILYFFSVSSVEKVG